MSSEKNFTQRLIYEASRFVATPIIKSSNRARKMNEYRMMYFCCMLNNGKKVKIKFLMHNLQIFFLFSSTCCRSHISALKLNFLTFQEMRDRMKLRWKNWHFMKFEEYGCNVNYFTSTGILDEIMLTLESGQGRSNVVHTSEGWLESPSDFRTLPSRKINNNTPDMPYIRVDVFSTRKF